MIPTAVEMSGWEMDYATENAAHYRNLADQHERGTDQAESSLRMAEVMKEYAGRLREQPLWSSYDASRDDGWAR
jgi:hypothetical protein